MPDRPVTMSVREFLRGGYKEPGITGSVIVVSGDSIAGVWTPGMAAVRVEVKPIPAAPRGAVKTETNGHGAPPQAKAPKAPRAAQPHPVLQTVEAVPQPAGGDKVVRPAKARRAAFPDLTKRA